MIDAPHLNGIDLIVASACVLACLTLLLLRRQRRQRLLIERLQTRITRERGMRETAEQALSDTRRQVCHLSASQQSLRDAERRRIARDLHDDLGQHLLALGFEVRALLTEYPAAKNIVERIDAHVQRTTRSLRTIVRDLQPEALENGLQGAVSEQLAQFSRLSGIPCRLDAPADAFHSHPAGTDKVVYRVLQESLSNIARHAQASQVSVAIARVADSLNLTVQDNGVGLPSPPGKPGIGLRGIAERVSEAGGHLDVASAPGRGTALTMSFPLH